MSDVDRIFSQKQHIFYFEKVLSNIWKLQDIETIFL